MTSLLTIRYFPDPVLRRRCDPVDAIGPAEKMLADAMITTMKAAKGVGLAAPQVGINRRLFVMDYGEGPVTVINPKILKRKGQHVLEEGCLSLPGVGVEVKRPLSIEVEYTDLDNRTVTAQLNEFAARVFCHEFDHLEGVLIIDYAGWRQKRRIRPVLDELSRRYQEEHSAEPQS